MPTQPTILKQGQSFMGGTVNFDAETGKPLLPGQTTTLPVKPSVAAENIGTTPYKIPVAPAIPDTLSGYLASANSDITGAKTDISTLEADRKAGESDLAILNQKLEEQTPDKIAAEEAAGLPGLNADLRDLQSLSKKQFANYLQNYTKTEQQAVPLGVVQTQQAEQTRQHGIDALLTNSLISAKQGDIATATESVDRAMAAKYDPIKQKIQNKLDFLKMNYDNLSRADKKLADAKTIEWNLQLKKLDIEKQNANESSKLLLTMAENDIPSSVLMDIQSKINNGATPLDVISMGSKYLVDPSKKLDLQIKKQQLLTAQKQYELLGEPTFKENQATTEAIKNSKAAIPVLNDKIQTVDALLSSDGLSSRVGTNFLSRVPQGEGFFGGLKAGVQNIAKVPLTLGIGTFGDIKASVSGAGQNFAGGVHQLVAGLTLDNLIAAKARGATFGALSEGELNILASSATKLNDWEIKDSKGRGTGVWNIDEASFKKELQTIQDLTRRALILSGEQPMFSSDETSFLDNVYGSDTAIDPASYYNNQ